ncbi:MAG: hypothetical protein M1833_001649 [Piccolia ochrophora]|nr:MAG: hypothetical protein M1833_001649 [Piccolia ochrophora]
MTFFIQGFGADSNLTQTANILGTIGTVYVSSYDSHLVTLLPQIWFNWRRKSTEGFPGIMVFLWAVAAVPFGVYNIVQNFNIPLQVQPQVFCAICLICWAQTLMYHSGWTLLKTVSINILVVLLSGGVEAVLILTLRGPYERGVSYPVQIVGIFAAILLTLGLVPPYFELWKRRGRAEGINFTFLALDWMGAFFSLMALVVQHTFDYLGGCLYIVCLVLESGIFLSHWIWLYRTRRIRRQGVAAAKASPENSEDRSMQGSEVRPRNHDEVTPDIELGLVQSPPKSDVSQSVGSNGP